MAVSNHLMLSTKAEEDSKDDLLSALSTMAYALPTVTEVPRKKKKKKLVTRNRTDPPPKRRSRFFYVPTDSIVEEVTERKQMTEPASGLESVNAEVEKRVVSFSNELPPELQAHIEKVREFFVTEIAPKTLAVQGGTAQALDVVQRTINSAIDPSPFAQFERMVAQARLYKMASFVASYMGLPKSVEAALIESVTPKKEVVFMSPDLNGERRAPTPRAPKPKVQDEED